MSDKITTWGITINGTVQGVGFRPFVFRLAERFGLKGSVHNGAEGVEIIINATVGERVEFVEALYAELPPLAHIDTIAIGEIAPKEFENFQIIQTKSNGAVTVRIPPDMSICSACETEMFDPADRRYLYPFITCTHCGVRYSIIEHLPYDRINTSMRFFPMCDACTAEYHNPRDRRYHAQPIGCWECGPQLSIWMDDEQLRIPQTEIIAHAADMIEGGNIIAIKGVGGYHLMCDATNAEAVGRLRKRKKRPDKPFAVMVKDIVMARELAEINDAEAKLLTSIERPVVVVSIRGARLAGIAPGLSRIGLFLPYAPLHLLLLELLDRPVVATSANISGEPICTDRGSLAQLEGVYDAIVDHDRPIVNGIDDSVVQLVAGQRIVLRRARGYAPAAVKLPFVLPARTLAMGANQKSTVAIGFENQAILSPHIGDLGSIGSVEFYQKNIDTLQRLYEFAPEVIVHDRHPSYESTKVANHLATVHTSSAIYAIQHHYAHILAVMAERGVEGEVFGVAFDGTGYGDDGTLWGGEFMVCDYGGYDRVGHIGVMSLIGAEQAIREPRRIALGLLFELYGESALEMDLPTIQAFDQAEARMLYVAWRKKLNTPYTSSVGRLFDGVASLLGVCQVITYEGQAGMMLESQYDPLIEGSYPLEYHDGVIDLYPMLHALIREKNTVVAVSRFFHTLVEMIAQMYRPYEHLPLVLAGGVFQNQILVALILARFPHALLPQTIPPNDGSIALGQIVATFGL